LGGGVETGILTQIYGVAGSGKTSIALQCALNCVSQGLKVIYIDTGSSFPRERFIQISSRFRNPDLSCFILLSPQSFTDQSDKIDSIEILAKEHVHLIVFDSIASLYRYSIGIDREENVYISVELCRQMATLLHIAERADVAALILNQVRASAIRGPHADTVPVASQVVDPWCKVSLRLERIGELPCRKAVLEKHYSRPIDSCADFSLTELGVS
jgi:DNA repair protein RadB